MNNPFKVGDKVRWIGENKDYFFLNPRQGEQFIVTCVDGIAIGFASQYPTIDSLIEVQQGKRAFWMYTALELVESVDDIPFNNQMKDIIDESI